MSIEQASKELAAQFGKSFKINDSLLERTVEQAIHEPRARETVKKQLLETIKRDSSRINESLRQGLLGSGKTPFKASRTMTAKIKKISTYSSKGAQSALRFISQKEWQGDWYKYKASHVARRLHFKRHGFTNSKDALRSYHVVAGKYRSDSRAYENYARKQTQVNVNDNLAVTRKRSKAINNTKLNVVNERLPADIFNDLGKVGSDLRTSTPALSTPHSTTRAVMIARHLNNSGDHSVKYSTRRASKLSRKRMPYVSTGSLAQEIAESFRIVGLEYNNVNRSKSRFTFSLKYKLDLDGIPADIKEAWIYSKPIYKQYVLQGTSDLALEYLTEILKSKYTR